MKKFYYLKTCSTCQRILKQLNLGKDVTLREIKSEALTEAEVDDLARKSGSYESIFSKRAMKYKSLGLKDKQLGETDFKKYILMDYTFLKRPVFETENIAIAGNSQKQVDAMAKLG